MCFVFFFLGVSPRQAYNNTYTNTIQALAVSMKQLICVCSTAGKKDLLTRKLPFKPQCGGRKG